MAVALVAALAKDRTIGRDNAMPWDIPADLRRFRALTLNHAVIMGRKTFHSIGQTLPQRRNLVITRRPPTPHTNEEYFASPEAALAAARKTPADTVREPHTTYNDAAHPAATDNVFVIGGGEIYAHFLPQAARLYLTEIAAEFPGDTYFPEFSQVDWREIAREEHPATAKHPPFAFVTYDRRTH